MWRENCPISGWRKKNPVTSLALSVFAIPTNPDFIGKVAVQNAPALVFTSAIRHKNITFTILFLIMTRMKLLF